MGKLMLFAFIFCLSGNAALAQKKLKIIDTAAVIPSADSLKPYQKYPTLPAFNIMEMDSSTIFNTFNIPSGNPIALMLFSPDCKHCKRTIKALEAGIDSIQNIQFYLVTASHNMTDIKEFYEKHHLADFKNIKLVGRDMEFFYFNYYGTKFVPDIALYDEHKKLVKLIEGETNASDVYKYIH